MKNSQNKLLELINKFSKVAGCKLNTQNSVVFSYTSFEQSKNEIKKTVLLNTIKNNKVGINLANKVQDLFTENYNILLK